MAKCRSRTWFIDHVRAIAPYVFLTDYPARSNFRLKRSGTNASCTCVLVCDLTMAIKISQKKNILRFLSRRSLRLSLSPCQPKITFVSRHTRVSTSTKDDSVSHAPRCQKQLRHLRASPTKTLLNFIILSSCYLVAFPKSHPSHVISSLQIVSPSIHIPLKGLSATHADGTVACSMQPLISY